VKTVRSPKEITSISRGLRKKGKSVGFVPTMGCLHEGHLSLIKKARSENDIVVVSIFINPTQFGPKEDFKKYPRNIKRDSRLAKSAGCDIIFYPDTKFMYPKGCSTFVEVEGLAEFMCGASRPTHFRGVTTVCSKLFNIVEPDIAYFGQKDYQQAIMIKKMVSDLNMDPKIKLLPIIREKSGLAMSSRNNYLTELQKKDAAVLYQALKKAKAMIRSGQKHTYRIKAVMESMILKKENFKVDYITIADPDTLKEKNKIDSKVLVALAVRLNRTRLIDNMLISV